MGTNTTGLVPEQASSDLSFAFDGNSVRVVMRDGDPWFVAADVCAALGISDSRQAVDRLDQDERGACSAPTPGGIQAVRVISEAGLYRLVIRSDKPVAKKFQRWVMHDVLPTIRRTGSYRSDPVALLSDPNVLRKLLGDYAERTAKAEAALAIAAPKADVHDAIASDEGTYSLREAAKVLRDRYGVTEAALVAKMTEMGWCGRLGGKLAPGYRGQSSGYTTTKVRPWSTQDGRGGYSSDFRVTSKGLTKLAAMYSDALSMLPFMRKPEFGE